MEAKRRKLNHKSEAGSRLQNGAGSHASSIITVELDTVDPISVIRQIIGKRLRTKELVNHEIFLQDIKLIPELSLYEQGVKVFGRVELSVQVETRGGSGKLTIVEIAKIFTDDEMHGLVDEPNADAKEEMESRNQEKQRELDSEKEELGIPCDPKLWTPEQVHRWMVWVAREFGLDTSIIKDLGMTGKRLSSMTIEEFFIKIPYGNILWSHLSLLKKLSSSDATDLTSTEEAPLNLVTNNMQPKILSSPATTTVRQPMPKVIRSPKKVFSSEKSLTGARSGNNGQIQLWQFLLELLTDADERHLITWMGHEGEFKLLQPERVAQKWGERKNKPAMNYEKLSRALRYYYDGDMISKVHGKRFVYKFVCNLKELLGYDAGELNQLVTECEKKRRREEEPNCPHLFLNGNPNPATCSLTPHTTSPQL